MWFFEALASKFHYPTDLARLQMFRIVLGTVLTVCFALSTGQGAWNRSTAEALSFHLAEQRFGPGRARFLARAYRPVLITRTIAALTLAAALASGLSLLLVLAGAAMELLCLESPNAIRYTLLTGASLLAAGRLGHGLHIDHGRNTASTWAQCLLVLITTDIYWNSAWQKLRSPQFPPGSTSPSGCTSTPRSGNNCPTGASTPSPASSATTWALSPAAASITGA
ncbi:MULTISPECIES: hypothetical protein [unclassified Streptomyces]|uniref:hypothetical protein n=1 Tax=unclassified Streptomyces TaxID=2593676 RepID=UPI002E1B10F2|nr:hypothetical protein OG217_36760 [Streptomyces sp. NBC_01023]